MERNLIAVYNMNGSYYLYIKELQNPNDSYCANLIMCRGIIECKIAISELKKYKEYVDKETVKKFEQYKVLSDVVENIEDIIPDYMKKNIIYYNCEGIEIPSMDKILEVVKLSDE